MTEQVIVNGIYSGVQYALIALGLTLIFALMNVLNFAHGQMYVLGAFVTYYVYGVLGLPFWLALVATALTLGIVGVLFEKFLFRPVLRRSSREESSMLLAAGTALLLESLILIVFGEKHRGVPSVVSGVIKIGDAYLPMGRLLVIVLSAILIGGFILFMQYTKPGRALRALAQDREAAQLQGVDVGTYSMIGFAMGAMLAGMAGAMLVAISGVNSGLGTWISIKAFIMVMIGGAGVVSGAIVGGLILGMIESIGYQMLPGGETYLFIFIGLIIFLAIRPHGLMGKPWG
ncbi:branched-chain amino acid ABC transporter permease [Pelagibius sp. Alg239-R121]|uniref:branched-chain amino acid ABC transporter permease n=1 Tax=Pelagibius sp. Alg239-R121 TaxID=2993448 RepID=UPI0024A627CC|nr:branched-chain amino acid ABC transporter permease [Pelagibius sp. Alg239-R121]